MVRVKILYTRGGRAAVGLKVPVMYTTLPYIIRSRNNEIVNFRTDNILMDLRHA